MCRQNRPPQAIDFSGSKSSWTNCSELPQIIQSPVLCGKEKALSNIEECLLSCYSQKVISEESSDGELTKT